MTEKGNNVFTIGFLIGAVAGVALGLLYAPTAGRETRSKLKEKADVIKDMASERIEQSKEAVAKAGKKVREKLGEEG